MEFHTHQLIKHLFLLLTLINHRLLYLLLQDFANRYHLHCHLCGDDHRVEYGGQVFIQDPRAVGLVSDQRDVCSGGAGGGHRRRLCRHVWLQRRIRILGDLRPVAVCHVRRGRAGDDAGAG